MGALCERAARRRTPEIERALAVGVRDARVFRHAALIAERQKDRAAAARYRREALALAPWLGVRTRKSLFTLADIV